MWRTIASRRSLLSPAAIILLLVALMGSYLLISRAAATGHPFVTVPGTAPSVPSSAKLQGQHATSDQLLISVVLHPNNEAQMNALLAALYDPSSPQYEHWLSTGQFNARFAPTAAQIAQVQSFLTQAGLQVVSASTPFLVRAVGTTSQIEAAFHTTLKDYKAANGKTFYQNTSAIQVPANLGNVVLSVTGLTNTDRPHPNYILPKKATGKASPEYGGGPTASGLTPSQDVSLYGGNGTQALGPKGQGKGATLAVFELSGYTESDIAVYEHQFFGSSENVPLVNIPVDGGSITPNCPAGDTCADPADFSGDIEVEADIETQIAMAPKIDRLLVYDAPNDETGATSIDEYFRIAQDNLADSISTSWGLCEQDTGIGPILAESIAFTEMALQGQSIFASSGDEGAFDCLLSDGTDVLSVDDPESQPLVTSVGGTSWGSYDPQHTQRPAYPTGFETIWNDLNSCDDSSFGLGQCVAFGADGGGVSVVWGRPSYQRGPGVNSSLSQKAPYCSLASKGQFCREVPDISANADEFTPYAEFCTGDPTTSSTCGQFSSGQPVPGWFGIGGTSLSAPVMAGIISLWDSVHGKRFGSANFGLYRLFQAGNAYSTYFHDITGQHQTENFNGFYPTTVNYDMGTGIGTPRIDGIVSSHP